MKILLAGVRGSAPCCGPAYQTYGGHTTCIAILGAAGERLLLDLGSGAQLAAAHLAPGRGEILALLSHYHLDHLQGLPAFAPLYDPATHLTIAAAVTDPAAADPATAHAILRAPLDRLLSPPLWPLTLDALPAHLSLRPLLSAAAPTTSHGGLQLRGVPLPHPGGCTAWRVDEPATGAALVFATDVEWAAAGPRARERFLHLCRTPHPASVLLMDGHLTADQVVERAGWGHSSAAQCLQVARAAGVGRLLVTHHAPEHTDPLLAAADRDLQQAWASAALARQATLIDLPDPAQPSLHPQPSAAPGDLEP